MKVIDRFLIYKLAQGSFLGSFGSKVYYILCSDSVRRCFMEIYTQLYD